MKTLHRTFCLKTVCSHGLNNEQWCCNTQPSVQCLRSTCSPPDLLCMLCMLVPPQGAGLMAIMLWHDWYVTHSRHLTMCDRACCAVCIPGYGSPDPGNTTCQPCPVNTYNPADLAAGQLCTSCPTGTVSAPGAAFATQCHQELFKPHKDYMPTSAASKWEPLVLDPANGITCQSHSNACRNSSSCIQLRIADGGSSCDVLKADPTGTTTVSFKVSDGMDYVRYPISSGVIVGSVFSQQTAATLSSCEAVCTPNGDCEGVLFNTASCSLIRSEMDPDFQSFLHVWPYNLGSAQP